MIRSKISGLGFYVPERIVTNQDLEKVMDTSDEWIVTRSGIRERRWVEGEVGVSDLGTEAARKAMEMAGIQSGDIDMVIVATLTSDYFFPGSSAQIQHNLGLGHIAAFDVKVACSAFIYALSIADQYIKTGQCKNILVIGAEVQSTALDISTRGRDISVLFGDGAGAAVVTRSSGNEGILSTHLHIDGQYLKELWCEGPASRENPRMSVKMLEEGRHFPYMNGREVFRHATTRFPEVIGEALDANGLTMDDVALVVPHQANLRISQYVAKKLGVGMDKVYSNIHKYGNTTGASIPIALTEAYQEKRFSSGDIVILAAFGAGFSWASAAIRW